MDSNRRPLVTKATTLPIESQPQPYKRSNFVYLPLFLRKLHKSTFSLDRASLINETNFKFTLVVGISKAASGLLVGFKVTPHTSLKMKVSNQFLAWSNFQEMFGMLFALPTPVVDVMKLFLRKSKKSPKLIKTRIRYLKSK